MKKRTGQVRKRKKDQIKMFYFDGVFQIFKRGS